MENENMLWWVLLSIYFWIVLSIAVGKYWGIKGRDFSGGLFVSILLSPAVGFTIGFLLSPLNRKKCPNCASEVSLEAKICKWCGYKFLETVRKKEESLKKFVFCPYCGTKNPEDAKSCVNCQNYIN